MADRAHEWTDEQIDRLNRRLAREYSQAAMEMRTKLNSYLEDYEYANQSWKDAVRSGEATREEYRKWLASQASKRRYVVDMTDMLANDAFNTSQRAFEIINDTIPQVYAENANWAAYSIENGIGRDTGGFALYDRDTVRRLMSMEDDDQVIHEVVPYGPILPEKQRLNLQSLRVEPKKVKFVRWNRQKFTSAITQSILQGESIPNTAKRLAGVLNMDKNMATRAARTAMTSAENAGRVDSYNRAKRIGIDLEQEWMATLDERTRHSHRLMDGEHVKVGQKFSNGLEFPGDPSGPGEEIWNCRCTLVAWLPGIEQEDNQRWSRLPEGMTYEQWKHGKKIEKNRKKEAAKTVPETKPNLRNVTGVKPKPWDDAPEDYYLPDGTRKRLHEIEKLGTYDEFVKYFDGIGIKLTTDLESLSGKRRNDVISAVQEQCQKIAVAIDAYRETFGPEALSKLTRIHLYDDELPNEAAYHFNMIGEDDPWAGTIRFRQWGAEGRTIFHELAHAFQDSHAEPWEDAITYSERMVEQAHLDKSFTAYAGASADAYDAERFADAFGYGFAKGRPEGLEFIVNVWKELRKPLDQ